MKAIAPLILLFAGVVIAKNYKITNDITPVKFGEINEAEAVLPAISWTNLREILVSKGLLKDGYIQADATEYATKVLEHVQAFIIKKGMEPLLLSDQTIKLVPTGTVTLTNGKINKLSTISLSDSVIVKYNQNTNILDLTLPLAFDSLSIDYNYRTKVTLLTFNGEVEAKIKNVKLNLHMGFNFTSFYAFVDEADVRDSGKISLEFSGQGIVDWVIELLSAVLTTLFHNIILSVINKVIDDPVDSAVGAINNVIDTILQRNSTLIY